MFDALSERLRRTLGSLTGHGRISEADVDTAMREVRPGAPGGGRQLQGRQGLHGPGPRAGDRERDPGSPQRRPTGRQDRQRRADGAPVRRRPHAPPGGQPGRHRPRRAAGLRQDDDGGEAGPPYRQDRPASAARRGRPVPAGSHRPAGDPRGKPGPAGLRRARGDRPSRRSAGSGSPMRATKSATP